MPAATIEGPLLLYDGACPLCDRAVRLVLAQDATRSVRFAPLRGETAAALIAEWPELSKVDSMIWVDANGRVFARSAAAIAIGRHLGGGWARAAWLAAFCPTAVRDAVYDAIARIRHRVPGPDACPVPAQEQRSRFLP